MSNCNPCASGNPSYGPAFPSFPPPRGSTGSTSSGSSDSGGTTPGTACPLGTTLPVVAGQFTAPAVGSVGQFQSLCASNWAIPGNAIRLAPFGNVLITGVSGDIISYENLSMPVGASIAPGQPLFQFIPTSTESGVTGNALEQIQGVFGGVSTLLGGNAFQIPRWQQVGSNVYLQNQSGYQLNYMLSSPAFIADTVKPDLTNPLLTNTASVTATYDLPGLPAPLPPSFSILLSIELEQSTTSETTYAAGFRATKGGQELIRSHYRGITGFVTVRNDSSQLQLTFHKATAGRAGCRARVYVHGYII